MISTSKGVDGNSKDQSKPPSLMTFINRPIKWFEDSRHAILLQNRQQLDRSLTPAKKKISHTRSYIMELNLSLDEKRKHIRANLTRLENAGILSSENEFQVNIFNFIIIFSNSC